MCPTSDWMVNMEKHQWKDKVQEIFNVCQSELKRTTEIGKKMLSASKTNSELHDSYESLGRLAAKSLEDKTLKWDHPEIEEILQKIAKCKIDLDEIEGQVRDIKKVGQDEDNKKDTQEKS